MKPYHQRGSVTIYCADSRKKKVAQALLAAHGRGIVIMDPPYPEYVQNKSRAGARKQPLKNGFGNVSPACISREAKFDFPHLTAEDMRRLAESATILAERWILTFCSIESVMEWRAEYEKHDCKYIRTADWEKELGMPQFTGDRPAVPSEAITVLANPQFADRLYMALSLFQEDIWADDADPAETVHALRGVLAELGLTDRGKILLTHPKSRGLVRGRTHWNGGGKLGSYKFKVVHEGRGYGPEQARESTAQKPEELMEQLVIDYSREGETVFDLTAGFGTTLIAAARLNRIAVGVENREAQAEKVARRIDAFYEGKSYRSIEKGTRSIFDLVKG